MNITPPVQYVEQLMLSQYRTSPNFMKWMMMYAKEAQEITAALQQCLTDRYWDNAKGAQLDVIGDLVGAKRLLEGVSVMGYFGYLRNTESLGMGREDSPDLGGPLRSEESDKTMDILLEDPLYKNWIEARIIKNATNCNIEDTIAFFCLIYDDPDLDIEITEPAPATIHIRIHAVTTLYVAALVKSVAQHIKAIGVEMQVYDDIGEIQTLPIKRPS